MSYRLLRTSVAAALTALALSSAASPVTAQDAGRKWKVHDLQRPTPRKVTPAAQVGAAPGDAVVLFDGRSLDGWTSRDGSPAKWVMREGYMQTVPGAGPIVSKQRFGDVQAHVEWATPSPGVGKGQDRGNSGVYFMGLYEIQVLDSYENETYVNGQAGSIYKQRIPLVNANRKPGEWQAFDIVWTAPTWKADGTLGSPAYVTAFHNGVLIHDHVALDGETVFIGKPSYKPYDRAPIMLQSHGDPSEPISFRNIWLRELK